MYVNQIGRAPVSQGLGGSLDVSTETSYSKSIEFHGTFPTNVSAIELSYDQTDSIEEFTVDLQVQWWDVFFDADNKNLRTDPSKIGDTDET